MLFHKNLLRHATLAILGFACATINAVTPEEIQQLITQRRSEPWEITFPRMQQAPKWIMAVGKSASGQTGFSIVVLDELPASLTPEQKELFEITSINGQPAWVFQYADIAIPRVGLTNWDGNNVPLGSPRIVPGDLRNPARGSFFDLACVMAAKRSIFYTGSWMTSKPAQLNNFRDELGFCNNPEWNGERRLAYLLNLALTSPHEYAEAIGKFMDRCASAQPTPGQRVLGELANKHNVPIITDNYDIGHQQTGHNARRVTHDLFNGPDAPDLGATQALICFGLDFDYQGVVGRYKDRNPEGMVICVFFEPVCYLDRNDMFVRGDIRTDEFWNNIGFKYT